MSRVKETRNTIDDTKTATIGNVGKPAIYWPPILSPITLSLVVNADKITEDEKHD